MSTQTGSEELNESVPHAQRSSRRLSPSSEERGCPRTSVRFEGIVGTLTGQEEQEEVIADIEELEDDS